MKGRPVLTPWGVMVMVLGSWETAAFASAGRVPTISWCVRSCLARHRRLTRVALAAWMFGLIRHLLEQP